MILLNIVVYLYLFVYYLQNIYIYIKGIATLYIQICFKFIKYIIIVIV